MNLIDGLEERATWNVRSEMSEVLDNTVLDRVKKSGLIAEGDKVILGISGGVDSVVLAHLLSQIPNIELHLAHVNYGLRGAASDQDQVLCETLADQLKCRLHILNAKDKSPSAGVQEWARDLRYSFFSDLATKLTVKKVAVAHHKDDQVETILHNLFRGAGIRGLGGMKERRLHDEQYELIRPLLQVGREEIVKYANKNQLSWREDQSNSDQKYTRSWIRSVVIPMLESRFGSGMKDRIVSSSSSLAELEAELLEPELARLREQAVKKVDSRFRVQIKAIAEASPIIQKQLLLRLTKELDLGLSLNSDFAERLFELTKSQKGKKLTIGRFKAVREKDALLIGEDFEVGASENKVADDLHVEKELDIGSAILQLKVVNSNSLSLGSDQELEHVDFAKIQLPLSVRPWERGDQFKPLGMKGRKLVSDFLTDKNVENWDREKKVVVLSNGSIVWVPGYGISEDFKLDSDSELALELIHLKKTS